MRGLSVLLAAALLALACAPRKGTAPATGRGAPEGGKVREGTVVEGTIRPSGAAPATAAALYRVQIFATTDRGEAERVAARAREVLGGPVDVDYEAPHFKVRVGDPKGREGAESLRARAASRGFPDAWIVMVPAGGKGE